MTIFTQLLYSFTDKKTKVQIFTKVIHLDDNLKPDWSVFRIYLFPLFHIAFHSQSQKKSVSNIPTEISLRKFSDNILYYIKQNRNTLGSLIITRIETYFCDFLKNRYKYNSNTKFRRKLGYSCNSSNLILDSSSPLSAQSTLTCRISS